MMLGLNSKLSCDNVLGGNSAFGLMIPLCVRRNRILKGVGR